MNRPFRYQMAKGWTLGPYQQLTCHACGKTRNMRGTPADVTEAMVRHWREFHPRRLHRLNPRNRWDI